MFGNIFGRGVRVVDEGGDSKAANKKRIIILIIIAAICVLVFGGGRGTDKNKQNNNEATDSFCLEKYTEQSETRLKEAVSKIRGAGEVEVMLSFETVSEKVLAKNTKNDDLERQDGEKSENSRANETSVMLYGSGATQQPYILKEKLPVPSGALIVASGAGDENVRLEIYEAVKALYGISGHRIKVTASGGR